MLKRIIIIGGILLGIIIVFGLKTVVQSGQFKCLNNHFDGEVKVIEGIVGGEDVTIHHARQIAFIAADDRFNSWQKRKAYGAIYSLDLKSSDPKPKLLTDNLDFEIHPHGLSLYEAANSTLYLYVVDHTNHEHSVLLFKYLETGSLIFIKKFQSAELMYSPNDVLAVDENRFYFTNDHGTDKTVGKLFEDYLQLSCADVIYFDGSNYQVATEKIKYANGINMSEDGKEVYVGATIGKAVLVYNRDVKSGTLTLREEIFLDTGVDNIELDEEGNLWIGAHPKLLAFVEHAKDLDNLAPSQVLKISKGSNGEYIKEEIYLDTGEELSASSVAAVSGNVLLIGPVFDNHILLCKMNKNYQVESWKSPSWPCD